MPAPTAQSFSDLHATPLPDLPCWVEPRILLKGSLMILSGPAAIGKTFLMLEAADNLSRGEALWGLFPVPRAVRVLLIEQEVGIYGIQERLRAKYEGRRAPEDAWVVTKDPEIGVDDPAGFERLGRLVETVNPGVLILDPATRFLVLGDESDNTAIARFYRQLDRLLVTRPNLSIILTHHFGKDPKEPAEGWDDLNLDQGRGASKWRDGPDLRVMVRCRDRVAGRPARWETHWVPRHAAEMRITFYMGNDFRIGAVSPTGVEMPEFGRVR